MPLQGLANGSRGPLHGFSVLELDALALGNDMSRSLDLCKTSSDTSVRNPGRSE